MTENKSKEEDMKSIFPGEDSPYFRRKVHVNELNPNIKNTISLFTGAGGFDIGFCQAGFQVKVMVEWNKDACKTLRANWYWEELKKRTNLNGEPLWKTKEEMKKAIPWYCDPEPAILERDIREASTEEIMKAGNLKFGEVAVIYGGPPCQGYSVAGKRVIEDPRNVLFKEYVRIVRESQPKVFVLENVPGMATMAKGRVIQQICEEFANVGFQVSWKILNAADYGVPQIRKRLIMTGKRIDVTLFPIVGNPQLHLGGAPGEVFHPEWFLKKYNLPPNPAQLKMNGQNPITDFL